MKSGRTALSIIASLFIYQANADDYSVTLTPPNTVINLTKPDKPQKYTHTAADIRAIEKSIQSECLFFKVNVAPAHDAKIKQCF